MPVARESSSAHAPTTRLGDRLQSGRPPVYSLVTPVARLYIDQASGPTDRYTALRP